ncbi:MAG: FKBP-type peptidyl-prolyl cis-trans isomerase [Spongiibacteraceae bacterium]|nr:FKBP-type peptidyl-prolyl cis-trans isomerase [Spongiibacteraceae bacterium]
MAAATLLVGCQPSDQAAESDQAALSTDEQKMSYAMGLNLGNRIKQELDLDIDAFNLGVKDAVQGNPRFGEEEMIKQLQAFQQQQVDRQQAQQAVAADKNLAEAEAFLAANAKKEGVVVTDSGLQYKVLEAGDGKTPGADDVVKVHYVGTLLDGTKFDSSYDRGAPVEFPVSDVIPGWVEALQLMPVGSKWQLFIPPALAYGPGGTGGGPIGPNAALIFEVELLGVQQQGQAAE